MLQGEAAADQASEPREFWLWPDNVQAWHCWIGVQTQWRVGLSGATGLDYTGVRAYLDELGLEPSVRLDVWEGIQACERVVLSVWADRKSSR